MNRSFFPEDMYTCPIVLSASDTNYFKYVVDQLVLSTSLLSACTSPCPSNYRFVGFTNLVTGFLTWSTEI